MIAGSHVPASFTTTRLPIRQLFRVLPPPFPVTRPFTADIGPRFPRCHQCRRYHLFPPCPLFRACLRCPQCPQRPRCRQFPLRPPRHQRHKRAPLNRSAPRCPHLSRRRQTHLL